jgi:hypothetical protein
MPPPPLPPQSPQSTQPVQPLVFDQPKKHFPVFLAFVLLVIISAGFTFAYRVYGLKLELLGKRPAPSPVVSPAPSAEPEPADPTADWQTYANAKQNYSFKYPEGWQLNTKEAEVDINSKVVLSKEKYTITIYANMQGFGGQPHKFPSVPITVAGLDLVKREIGANYYNQTGSWEIAATDSYPTFKHEGKTYAIFLTYPLDQKDTGTYKTTLAEFDQILSTFTFTDAVPETGSELTCGGVTGKKCPDGYLCQIPAIYPDATGTCVKDLE